MPPELSSLPCFEAFGVIFCPDFCSYFCLACERRGSLARFSNFVFVFSEGGSGSARAFLYPWFAKPMVCNKTNMTKTIQPATKKRVERSTGGNHSMGLGRVQRKYMSKKGPIWQFFVPSLLAFRDRILKNIAKLYPFYPGVGVENPFKQWGKPHFLPNRTLFAPPTGYNLSGYSQILTDLAGVCRILTDVRLRARLCANMTFSDCTHFRCTLTCPVESRETTQMTETTEIRGAKHSFPKQRV